MSWSIDGAIDDLERSGRLRDVVIYAFGHTAATEEIRTRLSRYDLALTGILDNNRAKQGGSLHGVPVIPPNAVADVSVPSVVLIASRFHSEMRQQLVDLGYAGEIIRVGTLSITTDTGSGRDIRRGARFLDQTRVAHPNRHLVVCPFGALGDVYWALAYLPAFAATRRLPPAVVAVVGEGCRQVARLFGHKDVYSLTQVEMDDLVAAVVAGGAQDATIAHHDRPYGDSAPVRALDERFVAFTDMYRDLVYKLPAQTQPQSPGRHVPANAGTSWASEIPRGRGVLIAPYAKSVVPVPWSFWEQTAALYESQGDVVATLVHADEEPVAGTLTLEIPIPELLDAVEHAGTFIGLRGGLCDVVHTARARKIHVFPDAYYSTTPYKVADFFALPGWESVVLQVS
ncbi:MAG TPA: hypothetical protein VFH80_03830 [Solirubrobacteraceae bacterium]|nr:hypothetical protein [Solirubrobacteraceae bacterium]